MKPLELLKQQHAKYKRALEKSDEEYEKGQIDTLLHETHVKNLTPLIDDYSKAIEIFEFVIKNSKDGRIATGSITLI